ncbi:PepSY domain-containing protein [Franzmannia qiaohouensis]|uniref:PepSY domain-containing protein n=1 Tax=Franzmannia qiaohouensis TaxID=1329370 RepID=A0ABU1H9N4_9GAMM|nr:PepSY domain-containing protein [Halomonas qiaohouensis]MDR5904173.1 PepSY domain-containing protein [Halomonas qiaohouensis]
MSPLKALVGVPVTALLMAAGVAHADRLAMDRLDEILAAADDYGITHFEEIEAKGGDSVEIEGWIDDEWYVDVRFSLSDGETLQEERERRVNGAWGMSEEDVRSVFDIAASEGMVEFEEIQIDKQGMIEIEGDDESGRELEVYIRQGSDSASSVDRD